MKTDKKMPQVDMILRREGLSRDSLIQVLHAVQEDMGYLPKDVLVYISSKMNIPLSVIHGVVTFYNFFKTAKDAEHVIMVCMGTACYVKNAAGVLKAIEEYLGIKAGEVTKDGKYSLRMVRCLGACGMAPVISVDGKDVYGRLTPEKVIEVLQKYK
ncbi:MAG: NADP-reducing hydrogenase subunit HndA [Elusimicrobia bacterium ADurb.Bin231]|nr:MAG: NADP-reducing hydrogenase subunit HndA [Elusimicrobia bacterium ADurb.Bin231]